MLSDIKCKPSANAPIGVFDSGVGGLTVVREIMRQMPDEPIVYFGDTARVPYGSKSKETIIHYSEQITEFLLEQNVKAIVVACNTASAFALEEIEKNVPVDMIGVVKPGAFTACQVTKNGKIGLIGTKGTIQSDLYSKVIHEDYPDYQIFGKACPLFVPLVEEYMLDDEVTHIMAERYLADIKKYDVDTLILGCTHYPLLRKLLQKKMGDDVTLVNPAYETAMTLSKLLKERDLCYKGEAPAEKCKIFVSDTPKQFKKFADYILPCDIDTVKQVFIEDY